MYLDQLLLFTLITRVTAEYPVDNSFGLERRFDGIGGLSGGSATSKLLRAYPEKQRNEILDFLFKPEFAASLQILKVEIGGDSQSSDATEASHMHYSWEENYQRGYEWWMMKEAKKRNPDIKLYGLPWNFPGWIANGTQDPYQNPEVLATYIRKWIQGAQDHHGLTIDFIGIWNERNYNATYIETLVKELSMHGLDQTQIVASDNFGWYVAQDMLQDNALAAAVDIIGVHYPGTETNMDGLLTGKQLWSSEDYSTYNDNIGGGCWARILNQNYVNGFMTSTIAWNLIDSYYDGLSWDRDSLMTARQPWSGNYIVESPIWMSAHTTQFTEIGWTYLRHGSGVGFLDGGGSYVSITSPNSVYLTIVIETMTHNHSMCIRPALPEYTVEPQTVTFNLGGQFANITEMNVWYSKLGFENESSVFFKKLEPIQVVDGKINLNVGLDEVYTLTTLPRGKKGSHGTPPATKPFPLPFVEDFESYSVHEEPLLFAQQNGAFEVFHIDEFVGNVMRQMVLQTPIVWCQMFDQHSFTMNVIGSPNWTDIYIEAEIMIGQTNGTDGVYIATRINSTGCNTFSAGGIFFFLYPANQSFIVSNDIGRSQILLEDKQTVSTLQGWNEMALLTKENMATGYVNGEVLFNITVPLQPWQGFVGVGTENYGIADFDNVKVAVNREDAVKVHTKSNRSKQRKIFQHSNDNKLYFQPGFH